MEWKESEHPRDSKGKFTDGVNDDLKWAKENDVNLPLNSDGSLDVYKLRKIRLDFFGRSKLKNKAKQIESENRELPTPPKVALGFASREKLTTKHHIKHVEEMGFNDSKAYEKAAIDFWRNGDGKIYYSKSRKRIYKYDEKSERFLSLSTDGIIFTFMPRSKKKFELCKWEDMLVAY